MQTDSALFEQIATLLGLILYRIILAEQREYFPIESVVTLKSKVFIQIK